MPVPFTTLMQETWDAAIADMDNRERQFADEWRMAFDAAHDGLHAMRAIWPQRHNQITASLADDARASLHAFEEAYVHIVMLAEEAAGSAFAAAIDGVDQREI